MEKMRLSSHKMLSPKMLSQVNGLPLTPVLFHKSIKLIHPAEI